MIVINFYKKDTYFPKINKSKTKSWIQKIVKKEGYLINEINIIFCSDKYLIKINKEFLSRSNYTDTITFDYTVSKYLFGEIYISIDRVIENAKIYSETFIDEMYRVIIHGILHLLKYNDSTINEKNLMTLKEDKYLALLHIS